MDRTLDIAITHMRHAMTGGVERYLNYIASYLADLGHNVTIICRSHKEKPHPKVSFVVLRPLAFGSAHRIKTFADAVEKHLKSHRYDIVYGLGRTYSQDVMRLSGGSHLTYLEKSHYLTHNRFLDYLSLSFLRHKVKIDIERKALTSHLPRKVICNSNMVKQDIMKRYGVPEERLVVIHNGTDIDRFNADNHREKVEELCKQLSLAETERVCLFLGTGYKRKGLDLVMKAFSKYLRRNPECKLLVAGYDSDIAEFKDLATKLSISDSTIFLGGRRDPEVLFAASDLYLLPTRYDPFANSTVEALASGLPVITSENNGGCELIAQNSNGSVIKLSGNEVNALFEAIVYWMEDETLARGSIEARKVAEQNEVNGKLKVTAQLLIDVYNQKRSVNGLN